MDTLLLARGCHSADSSSESKVDLKKNNKPVMEKRRRAKINSCLDELKSLILDALHKDPSRHNKLEKADILEMAVRHLQDVQRQQLAYAIALDPGVLMRFKNGFAECAQEVGRYVRRIDGLHQPLRSRLLTHMERCVANVDQMSPLSFAALASPAAAPLLVSADDSSTTADAATARLGSDSEERAPHAGDDTRSVDSAFTLVQPHAVKVAPVSTLLRPVPIVARPVKRRASSPLRRTFSPREGSTSDLDVSATASVSDGDSSGAGLSLLVSRSSSDSALALADITTDSCPEQSGIRRRWSDMSSTSSQPEDMWRPW